jgi:cyclin-dependent kinase 12/13
MVFNNQSSQQQQPISSALSSSSSSSQLPLLHSSRPLQSSHLIETITPETPESIMQQQQQHIANGNSHGDLNSNCSNNQKWGQMTRTIAHYERLEQIGLGTYGQVYRAICKDTGRVVAMKKMRIMNTTSVGKNSASAGNNTGMPLQLIREIKILKQLQHPNLLEMIEVVTSKGVEHLDPDDPIPPSSSNNNQQPTENNSLVSSSKKKSKERIDTTKEDNENDDNYKIALARERLKGNLFLVLEYMTHDLTGLMDVAYQFTFVQMKCIMAQLFKALKFMHEHKYVHRDIKSSNILLDSFFRLKLADFGLARSLEPPLLDQMESSSTSSGNAMSSYSNTQQDLTNKVITLWYRPPEILLGTVHYGCAVDVWSAGCILAELMTGKPLAAGKTEFDQLSLLADLTGTPDNDTWNYLMSLKKSRSVLGSITSVATEWCESEQRPAKLRDKYGPNSTRKNNRQIPETALTLLEKLLEWDPRKRLTAANALQNRYFWTQPVAPENPAELGRIDVAVDGHFHEFQTKQKRKQAKTQAEKVREQAVRDGASAEEASEKYDATYIGIMKQVAREGINDAVDEKVEDSVMDDVQQPKEKKSHHDGSREEKRRSDHRKENGGSRRRERKHSRSKESDDGDEHHHGEKKKRDRSSEKSDEQGSTKEKRRLSNEDRHTDHRSEMEKRSRKDSVDDDKVDDRESLSHVNQSVTSKEKKSGRRSRRDSSSKKDRRSRKSGHSDTKTSEKERNERRNRSEKHHLHNADRDDTERYRRPPNDVTGRNDFVGRVDRGPPFRGDDRGQNDHRRGGFDGARVGGPPYGDYHAKDRRDAGGPVYGDYRPKDRHGVGGQHGPPQRGRESNGPSTPGAHHGPSARDRDGYGVAPPLRRDFGPGPYQHGRDGHGAPPPLRGDFGPPGPQRRDARPLQRDEIGNNSGQRRDRDGSRGDFGNPGPRRDRDGPVYGSDQFYRRDGPPPRGGDFGPGLYRSNEGKNRDGTMSRRQDHDSFRPKDRDR